MKKTIMMTFVSLVGAFLFSTTAMAFDDLYTQDTAQVTKAGSMDVGGKILYGFGKKFYNGDSESADAPDSGTLIHVPLVARYGVIDKLEAFAILPIVSINKMWSRNVLLPDKSGIGDIWIGAKYAVMPDNSLTVRGALDLPAGSDEDGLGNPGGFGIDVAAMTAKQMDKLGFNGQVGLRWNAEGPDEANCEKPGLGIYVAGEGSYTLAANLDGILGLEYGMAGDSEFNGFEFKDSGRSLFTLNVGAKYKAMDTVGVRGDILIPLSGKNEFAGVGILVGLVINVK